MEIGAAIVELRMEVLQKMKNGTALWLSNSISGKLLKETQNTTLKVYMHLYIHSSVIYNSQDLETAYVSISTWADKIAVVHLHNGILLGHKKEGNLTFCNSMGGPGDYYAKWNKPVRERQIPYDLIFYVESNEQNKLTNKKIRKWTIFWPRCKQSTANLPNKEGKKQPSRKKINNGIFTSKVLIY